MAERLLHVLHKHVVSPSYLPTGHDRCRPQKFTDVSRRLTKLQLPHEDTEAERSHIRPEAGARIGQSRAAPINRAIYELAERVPRARWSGRHFQPDTGFAPPG
jgi:hypothetical protein